MKFILKQSLNLQFELSTESVLENSTPEELAEFLASPQEDFDQTLDKENFIESHHVKDEPLSNAFLVWVASTLTIFFAYATTLCAVMFLALISIEALHEYGKCSMPIGRDLQNNCANPDKWKAFYIVAGALPLVLIVVVLLGLILVALMKFIVIGRFKPGCYSVDGVYYFRWLYVHHLETFAVRWLLPVLPLRCSFILNLWLRLMVCKE